MERLSQREDRKKVSQYIGWNLEEMRKKRSASDEDDLTGAAKRSKSEASFPTSFGFTPVNDSSKTAPNCPPTPNSTDKTDVTLELSTACDRKAHNIAQYLEAQPRLLPPPTTKRKTRHPNKGQKPSRDGKITGEAVPGEAHVGAAGLDSSVQETQLFTAQNFAKKLSPTRRTKRKRTISSGMPVTKPGLDAYESRRALKPQGNSGTPTRVADSSSTTPDFVSEESLARLDLFRFKPGPSSVASGDNPGVEGQVPGTMLAQSDAGEPSSGSTVDAWTLNTDVNINLDRPASVVELPQLPSQKTGSQCLGGHSAQLPSPVDTSPIKATMTSSPWAVEAQKVPLNPGLHKLSTHALFSGAARTGQMCGFQGQVTLDGPVREERGTYHEEPSLEVISQDVECEDSVFNSEINCYIAPSGHSKLNKMPVVTSQGNGFANNRSYSDHQCSMLYDNHRTRNELNEQSDESLGPGTFGAQKDAQDIIALEGTDDGLGDSDLIKAVTQGGWEASLAHVHETSSAPNLSPKEDSEDHDALFGLVFSPNGTVHTSGVNGMDGDDWTVLDEEDHDLEAKPIDLTDAASSGRAALIPSSGNCQIVKLARSQQELAVQQNRGGSSTYPTNGEPIALVDDTGPKPIVRPPFPKPVRDRSPIMGLSADVCLRTCFRVGEALNVGCKAVRHNESVFLELYARVISSHREPEGIKQCFVFGDLFHDRPPHIHGSYEVWKGVGLWEYDSSRLLGEQGRGRMCRCIGKMKRESRGWKLLVLNIWEATWDDVEHVRGIVSAR